IDALARFYIVQEVMDNAESFHGSCYMHKDRGENTKLVFGPVWDFGNSYHRGYNKFIYQDSPFGMNWIGEIAKFPRFQTQVKNIWRPFLGDNYPSIDSYIDLDALARFYIVQEVMDNAESFHGSCYMHKDRGENTKLVFGPVWDFGNSYHRGYNKFIYQDSPFGMNWIGEIANFPRFQTQVKNIWRPFLGDNYPSIDSYIDQFIDQIADAAKCDAARWPHYGTTDIDGKKRSFKNAMQQKVEFLRQQWGDAITGISEITAAGSTGDVWYTLGGQRLDRKPTLKGIYIRNSKKVIVD
ncbi:MAG: CotH kinase family protein, partial [Prevotella sp.]|nr:CotH kinase family protein [Prevotella sp.]